MLYRHDQFADLISAKSLMQVWTISILMRILINNGDEVEDKYAGIIGLIKDTESNNIERVEQITPDEVVL